MTNAGKSFSYNNISKLLNISVDTVKEYISYAEESYLISSVNKFDFSVKKQIANQKKIYSIDTGIINAISFKFSEDKGRLLENIVYTFLKKQYGNVYYHKNHYECDFLIRQGIYVSMAIQVSASLKDSKTKEREIKGLVEAMKEHNLKEGLIITENESGKLNYENKIIQIKPAYLWFQNVLG